MVHDGDDATFINTDLLPGRLGHVEMRPRWVAPAAVVIGEDVVGRAKVRGRDGDRHTRLAKQRIRALSVACELVALPTRGAVIEQHGAQRRRACPVPFREEVTIPARATCNMQYIEPIASVNTQKNKIDRACTQ